MTKVNWIKKNQTEAFQIEKTRNTLAIDNKKSELIKTYSKKYPEIIDLNTPKLWDELNSQYSLFSIKKNNPIAYDRLITVSNWIKSKKEITFILDAGFGCGSLEELVLTEKNRFVWNGIDTSLESLKRIKSRHYKNSNFKIGSVLKIPYKSNSFDCVVMLEVIEHIVPSLTFKVLNEISRVLKKNGYLIISTPLNEGLEQMVTNGINPNAHVRTYTVKLLQAELEIAGYKITSHKTLTAFSKFYSIKKAIGSFVKNRWTINNVIYLAQKCT